MKSWHILKLLPNRLTYRVSAIRGCYKRDEKCFGLYGGARHKSSGFTLIELMIVIAIIGIVGGIGIPTYMTYLEKAKIVTAVAEIKNISSIIAAYRTEDYELPTDLSAVDYQNLLDPWGNPYQYFNIEAVSGGGAAGQGQGQGQGQEQGQGGGGIGQARVDSNNYQLNFDFDLYSMGKDGVTNQQLDHWKSEDDVIRGDNGSFFGPADRY